ncbi:hypothetical protein HZC31_03735 [Candidatus Woesearchaeota archaeon]|nr:hypothetical protein [Candidatus Woesearchaeota archaeon]
MKKKLFTLLLFIVLFLASCSDKTNVENSPAQNEETSEKCGDGMCDDAEQTDATLCPIDCGGEVSQQIGNAEQKNSVLEDTSSYPSLPEEFTFFVDEGLQMTEASNPGARVNDDGTISLLYEDYTGDSPAQYVATSEDGLLFSDRGESVSNSVGGQFRAKQLPDGTWRGYGYDTTKGIEGGCLTSQSSFDGITYTQDEGCRYTLQEEDEGWMGVYDFFADSKDNIVLLYLGDKYGLNNARRAYSTDGGWTFTFINDNVLNDEDLGGGQMSYVDEKVIVLSDSRVFLVAMQQGNIYGFLSDDDGVSFQRYKDVLLEPGDFDNAEYGYAWSLHDPQIAQLEDGRLRIYVAVLFKVDETTTDDDMWAIVSATTVAE